MAVMCQGPCTHPFRYFNEWLKDGGNAVADAIRGNDPRQDQGEVFNEDVVAGIGPEAFDHYKEHWLDNKNPDASGFATELHGAFVHAITTSGDRPVTAYWVESKDHRVSIHQSPADVRIEVATPRVDGRMHENPCGHSGNPSGT